MNRHLWLASALLTLTATGCVVRARPAVGVSATVTSDDYGTTYATVPPPAPIAEYRSPPPGYGYLWVDGYWDWTGYDWAWTGGYWAPERTGYIYVRPAYVYESGRWAYHRSYWNGPENRRDYDWGRRGPGPAAVAPTVRGTSAYPAANYGAPARGPAPGVAAPQPNYAPPPSRGGFGQGVIGSTQQPAGRAPMPGSQPGFAPQPSMVSPPAAVAPPPANTPAPVGGRYGFGQNGARPGYMPPQNHPMTTPAPTPAPVQTPPPATAPAATGNFAPRAMGAGRGFSPQPQAQPQLQHQQQQQPAGRPTVMMGARPAPTAVRPQSNAVPSGARPAPAPVQGGATSTMKRGAPPKH